MSKAHLTERISWAEKNLQWQLDWIGRHDSRTATILGIDVAMLGFLATEISAKFDQPNIGALFFAGLSSIALAVSLIQIYLSQFPNTGAPNSSMVFFGTISSFARAQFSTDFCGRTDEDHLDDLCQQTHVNAEIISKKFERLKVALIFLLASVLPWAVAIALAKISAN